MDAITVTRPVVVKVRVTEGYKRAAAAEIREAAARLDGRLAQLDYQYNKITELEKKNPRQFAGGLQQIEDERHKTREARGNLAQRIKEIGLLADGQEVVHGRVESLVEIKVGDNWQGLMSVEVVVEDGLVVEIRQGGLS